MATRRRRFTAAFKKRVALEALRGEQPVQAIAAKHQVHPNQVSAAARRIQLFIHDAARASGASGIHRPRCSLDTDRVLLSESVFRTDRRAVGGSSSG